MSNIARQLDLPSVMQISNILELAKSSYLTQFKDIEGKIKEAMVQAESNSKFLLTMKDSFNLLNKSELKDLAGVYPRLLDLVRMVWTNSPYFKSRDNITGLLQKVDVFFS